MNPVMVAAWIVVAILGTWFFMSCYYDARDERLKNENNELRKRLALAEFKLSRRDALREDFDRESV